ncbi:chorismate-binding protein [Leptolyngbya sp. 15MV]|nr:chorismate-binding protein [Leptolyngbya sp. 15MV]
MAGLAAGAGVGSCGAGDRGGFGRGTAGKEQPAIGVDWGGGRRGPIASAMLLPDRATFESVLERARGADAARVVAIPLSVRLLGDQLTPVLAYRRLVAGDARPEPSFLLESVEGGERQGRYSIMGAQPIGRVIARGSSIERTGWAARGPDADGDPLGVLRALSATVRLELPPRTGVRPLGPGCVLGGWFGYASYDSVRYAEPEKLPFDAAPRDDRALPDVDFGFYDGVVVFDHVDKLVYVVQLALVEPGADGSSAYDAARERLMSRAAALSTHARPLPLGVMPPEATPGAMRSNLTRQWHETMVRKAKEYIAAGDIFQVVLGQRFERESAADPFDVYRALRAVNPSPYMVYMQCSGCILVASSPEILCRVRRVPAGDSSAAAPARADALVLTNRPLAGTRRRGSTPAEDLALERELLADPKERAEHIMLVDLGRNDVGKVCVPGSIALPRVMEVERYSHVMHISSTVTGELRAGLNCWDALRACLPVGTISGAPKIRAMQIIDELEPARRGPYCGSIIWIGDDGTLVASVAIRTAALTTTGRAHEWGWSYGVGAGIVADSDPEAEWRETITKAGILRHLGGEPERAGDALA